MEHFTLPGTDLRTSTLGFGCASIMGRQGKRKSLNALSCAYDSGIIHFDVARSYGFGEAEKVVGRFIRGKRDKICLVSKFGILPRATSPVYRLAKPVVRMLMDRFPSLGLPVRRSGERFVDSGNFSVQTARDSLHTSLSELGVDAIDIYLLHDCVASSTLGADIFEFLDKCVAAGKIRCYGVASDPGSVNAVLNAHPTRKISVSQSPLLPAAEFSMLAENKRIAARIVHSVSLLQPVITATLNRSVVEASTIPDEIAAAKTSASDLITLLLRYAIHKTRGGVTLMSSYNPLHIEQNARSVETVLLDETIEILDQMTLGSGDQLAATTLRQK